VTAWAGAWWASRETTRHRDRQVLDAEVLPAFGELFLDRVSPDLVRAWVAKLSARVAPSSVRRTYTVLAQLLDAAALGQPELAITGEASKQELGSR